MDVSAEELDELINSEDTEDSEEDTDEGEENLRIRKVGTGIY